MLWKLLETKKKKFDEENQVFHLEGNLEGDEKNKNPAVTRKPSSKKKIFGKRSVENSWEKSLFFCEKLKLENHSK